MKHSEDMDLLDSHIRGVMMTMNAAGKCRMVDVTGFDHRDIFT